MKPIPDYFLALVKQHANLLSNSDAERATRAVTSALDATIEAKRSERLFAILPGYLQPSRQKFFVRLGGLQPRYRHATIVERLKISLQLTDNTEVTNLLKAYFRAVKTVADPHSKIKLARVLPPELNQLYIKS